MANSSKNPKCPLHRKYLPCHKCVSEQKKVKTTKTITNKTGREQTVTVNTGTFTNKTAGVEWCGKCSNRVINGTCTNYTCSTRS